MPGICRSAYRDTNSIHENNEDIYDPVTVEESEKIYDDIIKCSRESVRKMNCT